MPEATTINIVIADDHEIIRRGLKQLLSSEEDFRVVGEASNAAVLLELLKKIRCDVLLLDISMPGRSGIEVLKDLHRFFPSVRVLVLSIFLEDQYALRAIKLGACGYLTKETAADKLIHAIRKVAAGKKFITETLAENMALHLAEKEAEKPHECLSEREFEVMKMLASGKSVSQIAGELFIHIKTVSTYRKRILEKLHLKNNVELVRYCMEHHLID